MTLGYAISFSIPHKKCNFFFIFCNTFVCKCLDHLRFSSLPQSNIFKQPDLSLPLSFSIFSFSLSPFGTRDVSIHYCLKHQATSITHNLGTCSSSFSLLPSLFLFHHTHFQIYVVPSYAIYTHQYSLFLKTIISLFTRYSLYLYFPLLQNNTFVIYEVHLLHNT